MVFSSLPYDMWLGERHVCVRTVCSSLCLSSTSSQYFYTTNVLLLIWFVLRGQRSNGTVLSHLFPSCIGSTYSDLKHRPKAASCPGTSVLQTFTRDWNHEGRRWTRWCALSSCLVPVELYSLPARQKWWVEHRTQKMRRCPLRGVTKERERESELLFSETGPSIAWVSRSLIIPRPSVMRRRKADVRERKRENRERRGRRKERGVW